MELRVEEREWIQFQWPYLVAFLGGEQRVSELAYSTGAFVRRREIKSPSEMLQLLFTWSVAERSLRETAALSAAAGMADVSDVALMKRFLRAGDWLGALLAEVLGRDHPAAGALLRLRLIDASSIRRRGGRGTDARLHLSLDLGTHRIDQVELTDAGAGETLDRFTFKHGDIVIADRGYAHREAMSSVVQAGASFIVRLPWSNVPLETPQGEPFDLFRALRSLGEASAEELPVQFRTADGEVVAGRFVAVRKSEAEAEKSRKRALKERSKHGKIDPRTLEAAGYVFVLTNLAPEISAQSVMELYRFRWQVEMKFKTLKSVLHLGNVPVRSPELLRVYVLAKLLVALLIDALIHTAESFFPWGYPLTPNQLVASDSSADSADHHGH
jgi:Transposase DDE domain